ncbi:hypothetical protein C9F11_47035 (plasmid) [Streptomyces sp. YIM 121038]|uniref:hypothetical protein n=1 Tax=Streptomyces sp. YIM 121038 TaxID=2136401 RepID=UPI001110D646|nr:hypothetical protein [Streptomyces sp. YIM 121038]QCX82954.1 hypothetical protein C9F11_47035 [Streptomyces sp. YIM 121038]
MPRPTPLVVLYDVPDPSTLTPGQRSGADCVWCQHPLRPHEGIDLGGTGDWWPCGCVPCCTLQSRALATYIDWYDHGIGCLYCPLRPCDRARALHQAHLDARQHAGKPDPTCLACRTVIAPGTPIRPHLWQAANGGGPVFSFLHTRTCPSERVP